MWPLSSSVRRMIFDARPYERPWQAKLRACSYGFLGACIVSWLAAFVLSHLDFPWLMGVLAASSALAGLLAGLSWVVYCIVVVPRFIPWLFAKIGRPDKGA